MFKMLLTCGNYHYPFFIVTLLHSFYYVKKAGSLSLQYTGQAQFPIPMKILWTSRLNIGSALVYIAFIHSNLF